MAATLTAVSPSLVDNNGGNLCVLSGTFVAGRAYRVYVGVDNSGTPCYSGVSGQGPFCLATSSTTLPVAIAPTTPGDVPLAVMDTVDESLQLGSGILRAEAPFLCSAIYALRRDIRTILDAGETDPQQLPAAEVVPGFVP